jgi:hypothetical protein
MSDLAASCCWINWKPKSVGSVNAGGGGNGGSVVLVVGAVELVGAAVDGALGVVVVVAPATDGMNRQAIATHNVTDTRWALNIHFQVGILPIRTLSSRPLHE